MRALGIRKIGKRGHNSLSLKPTNRHKGITIGIALFLLCTCAGIIAGTYIKQHIEGTNAASSNITVTNNNQVVTHDQGTTTITRTSTVTIKDTNAKYGYILSARVASNSIPSASIKISSTSSTICSTSAPCTITSSATPKNILETRGTISTPNTAITAQGATTEFTITISLPTNTPIGNYLVDIAYTEEPYIPPCPVLQGKTYMQDISAPTNSIYGNDTRVVLKDRRNNQDYYVQNIVNQDGSCTAWMETNLRYAGDGSWDQSYGYPDDRYATTTANAANTRTPYDDAMPLAMTTPGNAMGNIGGDSDLHKVAGVADAGGSTSLDVASPANNTTFYGYFYNWCAAMGGQSSVCLNGYARGFDPTVSICPAGWRLPTGDYGGDFDRLNQAANGGRTNEDQGLRDNWLGVHSGIYGGVWYDGAQWGPDFQGTTGLYWSATLDDNNNYVHNLTFSTASVNSSTYAYTPERQSGQTVRCVKSTSSLKTLSDMTYLQDLALPTNSRVCANTPNRTRATLVDRRNGQPYYVEKIDDSGAGGRDYCWMETNLRYAGDGSWDSSWGYLDDRYATTTSNNTRNTNDNVRPLILRSSGVGTNNTAEYMNPGSSTDYININLSGGFYGYLYNWCIAMGGQANACNNTSTTGFDNTTSICPAGWRLPTGGTYGDFDRLYQRIFYPQNDWLGVYSGTYNDSLLDQGINGTYWSSNTYDATNALNFFLDDNNVIPGTNSSNKYSGQAVRCLVQ